MTFFPPGALLLGKIRVVLTEVGVIGFFLTSCGGKIGFVLTLLMTSLFLRRLMFIGRLRLMVSICPLQRL